MNNNNNNNNNNSNTNSNDSDKLYQERVRLARAYPRFRVADVLCFIVCVCSLFVPVCLLCASLLLVFSLFVLVSMPQAAYEAHVRRVRAA